MDDAGVDPMSAVAAEARRDAASLPTLLSVRALSKVFVRGEREVVALDRVSLDVADGEFVALLGPSGCGKSTLLNIMAGLADFTSGEALYRGQAIRGANTRVGYVTQSDTLLPWRTCQGNLELPLEIRGASKEERRERTARYLSMVGLAGSESHYPGELSGGMRKRLLLARSLIYDPECLLMDEPFGALDAQLRLSMHEVLQRIWMETGKTIVFVTHDIDEAVSLADRVVVMSARPGRIKTIERIDLPRPRDVYRGRYDPAVVAYQTRLFDALDKTGEADGPC